MGHKSNRLYVVGPEGDRVTRFEHIRVSSAQYHSTNRLVTGKLRYARYEMYATNCMCVYCVAMGRDLEMNKENYYESVQ